MAKVTGARGNLGSRRAPAAIFTSARFSMRAPADRHADLLAATVLAALKVALDALSTAAVVTDRRGNIVCSNAQARAVMGEQPGGARCTVPGNDPARSAPVWDVTPIHGAGSRAWSLLILRGEAAPQMSRWRLTTRQSEVLALVLRGLTNTGIAETLGIRLGTVEFHISAIFDKVGVNSRAALIATVMGQ